MRIAKCFGLLAALGGLAYWLMATGSEGGKASAEPAGDVVYLCRETQKLLKAPAQPVPAVNPDTGRPTLYRALYCSDCKKWHAVPPPDVFPGNPLSYPCPKHRRPMSAAGPLEKK